jgi:hypothetical protein
MKTIAQANDPWQPYEKGGKQAVVPEPEAYGLAFVTIAVLFYVSRKRGRSP